MRLQPTYEELKPLIHSHASFAHFRLQPTYEELKLPS